ncbi:MAG: hypothetical protein JOZ49_11745 [Mycolicibacterium sp.]|nr:hypothetical protein [Mycolicibacterium sp.]
MAVIMVTLAVWSGHRGRHSRRHLERLRRAAKSALAAAKSELAETKSEFAAAKSELAWAKSELAAAAKTELAAVAKSALTAAKFALSAAKSVLAAAKSALAAAASGDAGDPTALPPRRVWRPARVAIIAGLAIVALVMVSNWPTPTPTPQRRAADGFISRVAAHRKMLQAALFTTADPSLSRYDVKKWLPSIDKAMHDANIITPDQQAAFLAQIAEESGGLGMVTELPWGLPRSQWNDGQAVRDYFNNKYANINGNGDVSSGDGYNYRGRGILQITGKSNYAAVSEKLYGDDRLVKNPDLLSQPDVAGVAAAAYWNENNLNRFIPAGQPVTPQQFQDLGSAINTGHPGDVPNNADERVKYWEVAKAALGVT